MSVYVQEYFNKKTLSRIGYNFPVDDLTPADAEAFNIIASEINKEEERQHKMAKAKRKH